MRALYLSKEQAESPKSDDIRFRAEQAAESAINNTALYGMEAMTGGVAFRIQITIPEGQGIRAETSRDYHPLDKDPRDFTADEVRRLDIGQIDFFDREKDLWLVVYDNKHKILVEPVF